MQAIRNIAQVVSARNALSSTLIHARGLKYYPLPKPVKEIEYPERMKFKPIDKVPQYGPGVRAFKMQKRLKLMRGPETIHNTLQHKQFGVIALTGGRLHFKHFEFLRMLILRQRFKNVFAVYRVDAPWQPVTKKGQGQRMGGGKAGIHHYVTPIKAGRVIFELGGDCEFFEVKTALNAAAASLPFKAMAVSQEMLEKMKQKEEELEANNRNPWTWKYIIQNNISGCHKWISPLDKYWFTKYT